VSEILLGTLTIGQAPRADIVPVFEAHLPPRVRCLHAGVLDGFKKPEIAERFTPKPGEAVLITRLLDGSSVILGKTAVLNMVRQKLSILEAQGCGVIVLLCTGELEGLNCEKAVLIEPDQLVPPVVAAVAAKRRVGIVVPLPQQSKSEAGKFRLFAQPPFFAVASPYAEGLDAVASAANELRDAGAELVLLDCMGFTEWHREAAYSASGLPVILSNSLIARLLAEIV